MGKWQIPPGGGHMDLDSGVYLQNMTMKQINQRLDQCVDEISLMVRR